MIIHKKDYITSPFVYKTRNVCLAIYQEGVKTKNWQRFDVKLWQRKYWEQVIREQQSYETISNYIVANPANWKEDKFYKQ